MEIYSSNKDDSVLQDLGPFKLLNADNSIKGKSVYSYNNENSIIEIGKKQEIGDKFIFGNPIEITNF
ncbi:MAG: hypothetical protein KQH79_11405 [Bacteroidetes bacterium]|nr:hypothetical protein [Bacteroidota bacterium]